jgi:hypothetical protein
VGSTSRHTHKSSGLPRGLLLVSGYGIGSIVLGLAIGFAAIQALYRGGVVEWRRPEIAAALSLAVMAVCWLTMPSNRPHMNLLILRVAMVTLLVVGGFVARRVLLGPRPFRGAEIFVLSITTAAFAIGVWLDSRWRRKWVWRRAR